MKKIGLIGGLSIQSSTKYELLICEEYQARKGSVGSPNMVVEIADLDAFMEAQLANDWKRVGQMIVNHLYQLVCAQADFAAICSNTPHNAYSIIKDASPLEILTIMDATAEKIKKQDMTKVGLLGTLPTMEYGFFQDSFKEKGIETYIPNQEERSEINRIIWEELVKGIIRDESRATYQTIIGHLQSRHAIQGVILGCTEIPDLIKPDHSPVPVFNTTTIHASAILDYALKE